MLQYTWKEVQRDMGADGDRTTRTLFTNARRATARILVKEDGLVAGTQELAFIGKNYFKPNIDVEIELMKCDGERIKRGDVICELKGSLHGILHVERAVVNLLARMCGVATKTERTIAKLDDLKRKPLVTATRKTLWGLLDKRAAGVGGAATHRLTLADGVLIKDTHLDPLGRDIAKAIRDFFMTRRIPRGIYFFEIEVHSLHEALIAAETFSSLYEKRLITLPCYIMFDNMSVSQIEETFIQLRKRNLMGGIGFEASGGITEDNIVSYAKTGVDIISMGSLTHSARSLDLSLKVL